MSWAEIHALNPPRRRPSHLEDDLQRTVIEAAGYLRYNGRPLTDWLFHIPNGKQRKPHQAAILRGLGVKAGVPDIVLAVSAGGYGALWIELKIGKNTLTDAQLDFHQRLREGGQMVVTCRTLEEVLQVIGSYLLKAPGTFESRARLTA